MTSAELGIPISANPRASRRLIPRVVPPGSTFGVVAPSSAVAATCPRRFERGLNALHALGYKTRLGRTARTQSPFGYSSASPQARADDIHEMFLDPHVDAVLTTIGGHAAIHVLEHLDLSLIAANPKFLIGYSDTTLLQAALWHAVGLTSVAGPALLPQFGEFGGLHPFTLASFLKVMANDTPAGVMPSSSTMLSEINRWDVDDDHVRCSVSVPGPRSLALGSASGWLAPLNVESLVALASTEWFPDLDGALLVLEAAEETSAARFHQALSQLQLMGVFRRIRALAIGRFDARSNLTSATLDAIVRECVRRVDVPIICDLDFGHTDPMLSLPWGVAARVSAGTSETTIRLDEAAGRQSDAINPQR